jgi:Uma2 family endonuclease
MSAKTLISVEDFDQLIEEEFRYEIDEGELITLTRPCVADALIARELLFALQRFFETHPIGEALGGNLLYVLGHATKRAPAVSVLMRVVDPDQEIQGAPEIAAEILSPSNTKCDMKRKLGQFFASGCKLAWIIDPKTRTVEVWESAVGSLRTLRESDSLETPLLPGFTCPIAKLF